jgi:hypothetical protein
MDRHLCGICAQFSSLVAQSFSNCSVTYPSSKLLNFSTFSVSPIRTDNTYCSVRTSRIEKNLYSQAVNAQINIFGPIGKHFITPFFSGKSRHDVRTKP